MKSTADVAAPVLVWPWNVGVEVSAVGTRLKGIEADIVAVNGDSPEPPPSIGLVLILIATPIVAGVSLFLFFETGPIHRLGLYLIGGGVLVGGVLLLWRAGDR